jgi:hypothetical protein
MSPFAIVESRGFGGKLLINPVGFRSAAASNQLEIAPRT